MSVFLTETYMVKEDKEEEFIKLLNEFLKFKNDHLDLFRKAISWKLYKQEIGRPVGLYIEMWEFASLAEMEQSNGQVFEHPGMKAINKVFRQLVEPGTLSSSVWRPGV